MVHAVHSCGIQGWRPDHLRRPKGVRLCARVSRTESSSTTRGDTNVFSDMAIIRDLYAPKIAMLPIGDHFTMSPREAAYCLQTGCSRKLLSPCTSGRFLRLTGTPGEVCRRKLVPNVKVRGTETGADNFVNLKCSHS